MDDQQNCWLSTGSIKVDELKPDGRYVNEDGLGWEQHPVDLVIERLAFRAYHSYGSVTNYKNYQGMAMPQWKDLPESIQHAWRSAAQAVLFESGYTEGLSVKGLKIQSSATNVLVDLNTYDRLPIDS